MIAVEQLLELRQSQISWGSIGYRGKYVAIEVTWLIVISSLFIFET